jgi:hypothetical protein
MRFKKAAVEHLIGCEEIVYLLVGATCQSNKFFRRVMSVHVEDEKTAILARQSWSNIVEFCYNLKLKVRFRNDWMAGM